MEEDAEVADGELRLQLEPGEVIPALGDDHGVALRVALEDVDLEADILFYRAWQYRGYRIL